MKFIKDLLLSILKTLLIAVVFLTLTLSLVQKKFPPSLAEGNELLSSLIEFVKMHAALKLENNPVDTVINKEKLITNRENLIKEIEQIDPATGPKENPIPPIKRLPFPEVSKQEFALLKARLSQAEYKIRLLEYEMKQLKDEYKKAKYPEKFR